MADGSRLGRRLPDPSPRRTAVKPSSRQSRRLVPTLSQRSSGEICRAKRGALAPDSSIRPGINMNWTSAPHCSTTQVSGCRSSVPVTAPVSFSGESPAILGRRQTNKSANGAETRPSASVYASLVQSRGPQVVAASLSEGLLGSVALLAGRVRFMERHPTLQDDLLLKGLLSAKRSRARAASRAANPPGDSSDQVPRIRQRSCSRAKPPNRERRHSGPRSSPPGRCPAGLS